jgi:phage-related protein
MSWVRIRSTAQNFQNSLRRDILIKLSTLQIMPYRVYYFYIIVWLIVHYMIDIVYYLDKNLGLCPVKKYLEKYESENILEEHDDLNDGLNRNMRLLFDIKAKIEHVAENNGFPDGRISKPMREYNVLQIRAGKLKKIVIRINYICYKKSLMILLHAYEKPSKYKTKKEKNLVDKELKKSQLYANKFLKNPNSYEK